MNEFFLGVRMGDSQKKKKSVKKSPRMEELRNILYSILDTQNPEEILKNVLSQSAKVIGADAATIVLWESELGVFNTIYNIPKDIPMKGMILMPDQGGLDGRIYREEGHNFAELINYSKNMDALTQLKPAQFQFAIGAPIYIQDEKMTATLCFYFQDRTERFTDKEKQNLKEICSQIGVAILNARLYQELDEIRKSDKETKNFLDLLVNSSPDIIINTDLTGKIKFWNIAAEDSLGYSANEMMNSKLPLVKGPNEEDFYVQFTEVRKGEPLYDKKFIFRRKGSQSKASEDEGITIALSLIPVDNQQEGFDSILITGRDISEQQDLKKKVDEYNIEIVRKDLALSKKEKQLSKTKKELNIAEKLATIGTLSSKLNHQINNPLMGLLSILSIVLDDLRDLQEIPPEKSEEIWKNIEEMIIPQIEDSIAQGNRIKYVLKELRYFSSVAKEVHFRENTDLVEVLNQTLDGFQKQKKTNDTKLKVVKEINKAIIYGNFSQLQFVIKALINNALKAIELNDDLNKNGIVEIRIEEFILNKKKFVRIEVMDNGIGIRKDQQEFLFEPFYTAWFQNIDNPDEEPEMHVGLNLATTKTILQNHNAFITVKTLTNNEAKEENGASSGTKFILDFPLI